MKAKIFLAVLFVFALIGFVSAVPAASSPVCDIEAFVLNSTYVPTYFQPDNGLSCNDGGRNISESYLLKVILLHVGANNPGEIREECRSLYPPDSEILITVKDLKESVKYEENSTIKGDIHFDGDECSHGIYLTNYNISESVCSLDSDCPLGTCPDGSTYRAYSCLYNQCGAMMYITGPCMINKKPQNCSLVKCPNAYWDTDTYECQCGKTNAQCVEELGHSGKWSNELNKCISNYCEDYPSNSDCICNVGEIEK